MKSRPFVPAVALLVLASCGSDETQQPAQVCQIPAGTTPDYVQRVGCVADFELLASPPLDAAIPGARSLKFVVDRLDNAVYFQNSKKYQVHWEFASAHLSGNGKPTVPALSKFNQTEYYAPNRRFLLGSLTRYEGPKVWAYEIAPYDNASADMIAAGFDVVARAVFMGNELVFHPTSDAVERTAAMLPARIRRKSTTEIFAAIEYQPLTLATGVGRLRFVRASELEATYVSYRDLVVLDLAPNDIGTTSGIITEQFQTPLSHVNVLSQNRGTPNMGLKNAFMHPTLRPLDGKWVKLVVGAFEYSIVEVTQAEADAWWEAHKPTPLGVPRLDLQTRELRDVRAMIDKTLPIKDAVKANIPAFGGKTSHFAALTGVPGLRVPQAFGVPVAFYKDHMEKNGLAARLDALLADPTFRDDPKVREAKLTELRTAIKDAPLDPAFESMLLARIGQAFPGVNAIRFRSSTNAEDLEGFTGAGLYTSKTGHLDDPMDPPGKAIKTVWASVWFLRAFEERAYRGIDHKGVGMSVLVQPSFTDEEVNGVALTANPFDPSGLEPGFYVNVQKGETEVVAPPAGVRSDEFIYHFSMPGQPVVFLDHSTLVPAGTNVLTAEQTFELGQALDAIHTYFQPAYGPVPGATNTWYAMDVEFKFDQAPPGTTPVLWVKQARPHPGRGQ